jgi:DNA-binding NtrC family response regulator
MVEQQRFRADLMYRLNAVTLRLPPLRERPEDIPLLAHLFLRQAERQCRKSFPGFAPDALWALSLHPFPGNVRELDNEVLRAAALTPEGQPIPAQAFSDALRGAAPAQLSAATGQPLPLREVVQRAERAAIEQALATARGNVSEAARLLEVTRPGLYKAMERLNLR